MSVVRMVVALAAIAGIKGIWCAACRPSAESLQTGDDLPAWNARKQYLMSRVRESTVACATSPSGIFAGEWALVTLSMTASATCNLAFQHPQTRPEALADLPILINRALDASSRDFDRARWHEDPIDSLDTSHGHVGYLGHLNLMIGCHRALGGDGRFDDLHDRITQAMVRRMDGAPTGCVATYPGEIYTSDNAVAAASIAVYDTVTGQNHRPSLQRWVDLWRSRLVDRHTGLVAFSIDWEGRVLTAGRGSGMGWNSFYLPFVDEGLAADQWSRMKDLLAVGTPITAMREYPRGQAGMGDVDSGPVLFGLSPSGTGFAVAGARWAGDWKLAAELLSTAELVGSSVQWGGKRRYLMAPLVGDAILLAMSTATRWDGRWTLSRRDRNQ